MSDVEEASALQAGAAVSGIDVGPEWFIPKHKGARYYSVLTGLHDHLRPNAYLEVGIRQGHSLALAHCPSIGIDPRFTLEPKFGLTTEGRDPPVHLFETTSDRFFEKQDALQILQLPHVDFLFLDGMHQADFLMRDIINAERLAAPQSIIALHDCVPIDIAMTLSRQERALSAPPVVYPNFWAGDVWRVIPIIKKYRPDIVLHVMDAHPTGLVLMTGLNRNSTVLSDNYDAIVAEMKTLDLLEIGLRNYVESLPLRATADYLGAANLARHFPAWGGPGPKPAA
jgi:hypothetical protein